MLEGGTRKPEVGVDVGSERPVEIGVGELVQSLLAALLRGVGYENVQSAEAAHCCLDGIGAELRIGQVAAEEEALGAGRFDDAPGFVGVGLFLGKIGNCDTRAFTRVQ